MIISHSNNTFLDLREEDSLSIVDKMAGPNVSYIRRCPLFAGVIARCSADSEVPLYTNMKGHLLKPILHTYLPR